MACSRIFCNLPRSNLSHNIRSISVLGPIYPPTPESEKKVEVKVPTHTGQVFDPDDYRNVRFVNSTRYVNKNFAIDLIAEIPPKECTERVVSCDGDGPLGHPKVYINLDKPGPQACGYCGLRFVKKDDHHH